MLGFLGAFYPNGLCLFVCLGGAISSDAQGIIGGTQDWTSSGQLHAWPGPSWLRGHQLTVFPTLTLIDAVYRRPEAHRKGEVKSGSFAAFSDLMKDWDRA